MTGERCYTREDYVTHPRHAGQVKRYHVWTTLQTQTVAEHSWQVYRIYQHLFGVPTSEVAAFIMWHDAGELVSGDLPFPIKSLHPELKKTIDDIEHAAVVAMGGAVVNLSDDERLRVKLCDLLEMWEFGAQEVFLGNRFAEPIMENTRLAALRLCKQIDDAGLWARLTKFTSYPWRNTP